MYPSCIENFSIENSLYISFFINFLIPVIQIPSIETAVSDIYSSGHWWAWNPLRTLQTRVVILLRNILWSSIFFSVIFPAVLTQPWLWKFSAIILYIILFILSVVWHYFWKDVNKCLFTPGKEPMTENRSNTAKAQARELTISLGYLQKHGWLKAPIVYPIMGDNWWTWQCWIFAQLVGIWQVR